MRIAVTYENGQIFQHFGHTEQFKVYDVEDGKVVKFSMMLDYLPVSPMVTVRNYATYGVLLIFPIVSAISYFIGFKDIVIMEKLVYKNSNKKEKR